MMSWTKVMGYANRWSLNKRKPANQINCAVGNYRLPPLIRIVGDQMKRFAGSDKTYSMCFWHKLTIVTMHYQKLPKLCVWGNVSNMGNSVLVLKYRRSQVCSDLLEVFEAKENMLLFELLISNESWAYHYDVEMKIQSMKGRPIFSS